MVKFKKEQNNRHIWILKLTTSKPFIPHPHIVTRFYCFINGEIKTRFYYFINGKIKKEVERTPPAVLQSVGVDRLRDFAKWDFGKPAAQTKLIVLTTVFETLRN